MGPKSEMIVDRNYQKGARLQRLIVREISGGDIDGSVFQFETWLDNQEDVNARVSSGDIYLVWNRYFSKLLELREQDWKKMGEGVFANPNTKFFYPSAL